MDDHVAAVAASLSLPPRGRGISLQKEHVVVVVHHHRRRIRVRFLPPRPLLHLHRSSIRRGRDPNILLKRKNVQPFLFLRTKSILLLLFLLLLLRSEERR